MHIIQIQNVCKVLRRSDDCSVTFNPNWFLVQKDTTQGGGSELVLEFVVLMTFLILNVKLSTLGLNGLFS